MHVDETEVSRIQRELIRKRRCLIGCMVSDYDVRNALRGLHVSAETARYLYQLTSELFDDERERCGRSLWEKATAKGITWEQATSFVRLTRVVPQLFSMDYKLVALLLTTERCLPSRLKRVWRNEPLTSEIWEDVRTVFGHRAIRAAPAPRVRTRRRVVDFKS